MDLDEGVDLALAALASVNDDELSPEGIGVATVDVETETFGQLTDEEKEAHLAEEDRLTPPKTRTTKLMTKTPPMSNASDSPRGATGLFLFDHAVRP